MKMSNMVKSLTVMVIMTVFTLPVWGTQSFAEENTTSTKISVLEKNYTKVNKATEYSNLPKEVTDLLKVKGKDHYDEKNKYPYGQSTWYVWLRAKENGREYADNLGQGGAWWETNHDDSVKDSELVPIPQSAVSMDREYTELFRTWGFFSHVAYVEYVDSKGYVLLSETGNDGLPTGHAYYRIITPKEAFNSGLKYARPDNWQSISDWGKNPDGTFPPEELKQGQKPTSESTDDEIMNADGTITKASSEEEYFDTPKTTESKPKEVTTIKRSGSIKMIILSVAIIIVNISLIFIFRQYKTRLSAKILFYVYICSTTILYIMVLIGEIVNRG